MIVDVEQRWRTGRTTWATIGFDPARHHVERVAHAVARTFVCSHHYSASYPAARFAWGLFRDGELAGVCVFGVPPQNRVLTLPFPDLEPLVESIELSRLILLDLVEKNGESWFMARVFADAALLGIRGIVAFSDPMPRCTAAGEIVKVGHIGCIYKASNALYLGRSNRSTITVLNDGTTISNRSLQKVRGQERGHGYVERRLIAAGGRPLTGEPTEWLRSTLADVATSHRHPGNLRYGITIGRHRRKIRLGIEPQPYLQMNLVA